ncbi:Hypothetical protein CINCED_3A001096 [Cinara cedri]|uniref:Uncharacterized protein n=1 Tax=Cinara cedri TaxID=506608 RepID=A0A5E4MC04_9HEMI|nr:Hypothetical protein CINCED_3A001096 [Cinara cedri]
MEYIKQFLGSSLSIVAEQQALHPLLQRKFGSKETGNLTPAALSYISYLRLESLIIFR